MPFVACAVCNNSFYVKPSHQTLGWGKYCSVDCRTKAQIKGKFLNCSVCNKQIYRSPSKINHSKSKQFFCSKSCQIKWRNSSSIGSKHPNWINGINTYRNILLRTGKVRSCICCKLEDTRLLSVHHVDHDRSNNDISNLVWICFNCHYLVHHDKNFENNFRKLLVLNK